MKILSFMLSSGVQIISKFDEDTKEYVDPIRLANIPGMGMAGEPFAAYCLETRYKIDEKQIVVSGEANDKVIALYSNTLQRAKASGVNVEDVPVLTLPDINKLVIPSGKLKG